jgi:AcrR family transcriptional regulator
MGARAAAAEATHRNIVAATVELFRHHDPDAITLEQIAERAGVTLQTVLRRFGTKHDVFTAAARAQSAAIQQARQPVRANDPRAAIETLIASYEQLGDLGWRMLRFEGQHPAIHEALVGARATHRAWLAEVFAERLPRRGAARDRAIEALFGVTDFYLWKLYRIDLGRTREETEATMRGLVEAVLA